MYQEIINKIKPELDKTIEFLEQELAKIRSAGLSPSLVENIMVDCFDQSVPLKQLGAITSPKPREIVIQPWDKSYIEAIEKAIFRANLSVTPVIDKDLIRLSSPSLTGEYRKKLLRILSEQTEATRKTVRRWREEAWKEIQKEFQEGKISEDGKFRAKDELQKIINEYNKKVEEIKERKTKEIEY